MSRKANYYAIYAVMLKNEQQALANTKNKTDSQQKRLKTVNRRIKRSLRYYMTFGILQQKPRFSSVVPDFKHQNNKGRFVILSKLLLEQHKTPNRAFLQSAIKRAYNAFSQSHPAKTNSAVVLKDFRDGLSRELSGDGSLMSKKQQKQVRQVLASSDHAFMKPLLGYDTRFIKMGQSILDQHRKFKPDKFLIELYKLYQDYSSTHPEVKEEMEILQNFGNELYEIMNSPQSPFTEKERSLMKDVFSSDKFIYLQSLFMSENEWALVNYDAKYLGDQTEAQKDQYKSFASLIGLMGGVVGRFQNEKREASPEFNQKIENLEYGVSKKAEKLMIASVHKTTDAIVAAKVVQQAVDAQKSSQSVTPKSDLVPPISTKTEFVPVSEAVKDMLSTSSQKSPFSRRMKRPTQQASPDSLSKSDLTKHEMIFRSSCESIRNLSKEAPDAKVMSELNAHLKKVEMSAKKLNESLGSSNPALRKITADVREARRTVDFYAKRPPTPAPRQNGR